jgi:tight adherence protein C
VLGIIILLFAAAAFIGAVAIGTTVQERAHVRDSLRQLEGYQIASTRDQEMLEPLSTRVIGGVTGSLTGVARKFTPVGYTEQVKRKILLAGNPPGIEVDRILVLKVFGAASGILWVPLVFGVLNLGGLLSIVALAVLWFTSFMGPDMTLDRRVEARKSEIRRTLPDLLDLLVISVEAGLGFEQALERTATAVPGTLSDEFRRFLQETRLGAARSDALRALDERTDVLELRSFILAMLQADTFGVSIARILRSQAQDMRIRRRQLATEAAQKAPVKLLMPLVFCIFPAIFVVILFPALIQISDAL